MEAGRIKTEEIKTGESADRQLRLFARMLARANASARLTGPSDEETLYREHVRDALAALPSLEKFPPGSRFADVGTGGGLPGIAWGICRPDLSGVLIDSVGKKIAAVRSMATGLGLKNITALHARSEELARESREKFDAATARAVSEARTLAEYLSPLVRVGGLIIAFKGPNAETETEAPPKSWLRLGLGAPKIEPYGIAGKNLNLVIWEKIAPCPAEFPRKPGEAKRNPWR